MVMIKFDKDDELIHSEDLDNVDKLLKTKLQKIIERFVFIFLRGVLIG